MSEPISVLPVTHFSVVAERDLFGAEPFDPFSCGAGDFPPDIQSKLDEMQVTTDLVGFDGSVPILEIHAYLKMCSTMHILMHRQTSISDHSFCNFICWSLSWSLGLIQEPHLVPIQLH